MTNAPVFYDHTAPEYQPRLKIGHHSRTTTKFRRHEDGELMRDAEGYLVPCAHEKDIFVKKVSTPEERADSREMVRKKSTIEKRAITRARNRISKRQNIGDPDCVQSRDEDFPLLAVLRRDKAHGMIASVLAYRQLVALCEAEPLKGQSYGDGSANGVNIERRSVLRNGVEEVNSAAKAGFKGRSVGGGEIKYRSELKRGQGAYDIPAKRILAAEVGDDGTLIGGKTESLHIKINEETIADYIDKKFILARIRSALGPLLDPVDDAVLGGQTLGWIGHQDGHTGRAAEIAGKSLVYRGLAVLDSFLGFNKYDPANDNYMINNRKSA